MPVAATQTPHPVQIIGTGIYSPRHVVTSDELDVRFHRDPGASFARSGVQSRHWASGHETSSWMAARAIENALDAADLTASDLDAIVLSAVAPEQPMPTTAVLTLAGLGVPGGRCEAFDVNASCVGWLTALSIAQMGVSTHRWDRVAVVASEIASVALNHSTIETSALFGDGAAAAIMSRTPESSRSAVLASRSTVWPEAALNCRIDGGGTRRNPLTHEDADPSIYQFQMEGMALLRQVGKHLPRFLEGVLADAGLFISQVDAIIPHQASGVGLRYLNDHIAASPHSVVNILAQHGNQVSASIPTALHHAITTGRLHRGDIALLIGTGAGLSISATVIRY